MVAWCSSLNQCRAAVSSRVQLEEQSLWDGNVESHSPEISNKYSPLISSLITVSFKFNFSFTLFVLFFLKFPLVSRLYYYDYLVYCFVLDLVTTEF